MHALCFSQVITAWTQCECTFVSASLYCFVFSFRKYGFRLERGPCYVFRDNGESVGGGITPRHLSLSLCLATGTFDVTIRGRLPKEQVLKLRNIAAVTSAQGMPVRAWDLYVGARLNILNNPVSLRACDVPTGMCLIQSHVSFT